jgi:hypothetical protein
MRLLTTVHNVTAAYGIEGFTEEHVAAFKQHGTERVLIAYDRDDAGERGAAKVAERLIAEGIECFRIQFPKGMDANEYALKVQPAAKSLGLLIRKAVWLGKGAAPVRPSSMPTPIEPAAKERTSAPIDDEPAVPPLAAVPAEPMTETLPASPMPTTARELPITVKEGEHGREVTLMLGEGKDARRYRVRGLAKNLAVDVLKVNLMVSAGDAFHVDTLDLYGAKPRGHYIAQAAQETGIDSSHLKADLGRVLLALEQLQDETITKTLTAEPQPQMDEAEQQAALALLKSPDLIERILADFAACGLVGEQTNKLVGYLAAVSRKLDRPLGVVIQSSSAAGKTSLMDAVLAFVPEEEKVKYSAMTGQSLFYMGETNLKHKALAIVEEEGASRASYALKLLQSEGELTIASTGKDPQSGNLITQQYRVEGPVALLFTTTARDLDEELMNRCLVLAVDEGREQTRAIHERQRARRTLEGLLAAREREALTALHQNAQRLLRPLDVLNPYAQWLTFPDQTTRLRRDHEKYLTLIDTIAFVHQHQRRVWTAERHGQRIEYIEATLADITRANAIAHDVLGRSLDELPPQTRRLLTLIDEYVRGECKRQAGKRGDVRFSRRVLREAIDWGDTQLKLHLARLVELEYLIAHRTKTGGNDYELVYDLGDGQSALRFPGLADIEALRHAYDGARSGSSEARSAPGRGLVGPRSVGGRDDTSAAKPAAMRLADDEADDDAQTHCSRLNGSTSSYAQPFALASLAAGV